MMNYGSRVLLSFDEQGREVSGGMSDADPRGGVFGPQGYGGGIFDGSMGEYGGGGLGDAATDCTVLCAPLMLSLGPAGVAVCMDQCGKQTVTHDCFVPSVCKSVVQKFPELMSPDVIAQYCQLPPESQTAIESQCNAIAWAVEQSGGVVPAPSSMPLPVPPAPAPRAPPEPEPGFPIPDAPGVPAPPPATEEPAKAGMSGGLVATIAVVGIIGLAFFLTGKGKH